MQGASRVSWLHAEWRNHLGNGSQTGSRSNTNPLTGPSPFSDPTFGEQLEITAGPIDLDRARFGIDEPARLRPICDPFAHFLAENPRPVSRRFKLNHKVGTKMPVASQVLA